MIDFLMGIVVIGFISVQMDIVSFLFCNSIIFNNQKEDCFRSFSNC